MFRRFVVKSSQVLQQSLILVLRAYRWWLSPLLGKRCRFYPSCSQYAIDALTHCNLIKGIYLISKRILCCHPFHPGGYDPLITKPMIDSREKK